MIINVRKENVMNFDCHVIIFTFFFISIWTLADASAGKYHFRHFSTYLKITCPIKRFVRSLKFFEFSNFMESPFFITD